MIDKLWEEFENSGKIDAYLNYINYKNEKAEYNEYFDERLSYKRTDYRGE